MIYGLVAPGYEMAEIAAANLLGEARIFTGADLSTKLKLMGVDVASFGDCFADDEDAPRPSPSKTRSRASYKKLVFNPDGTRLLGGILVGDASEYGTAVDAGQEQRAAADAAERAAARQGRRGARAPAASSPPSPTTPRSAPATTSARARFATPSATRTSARSTRSRRARKAGTGCGGCLPLVTDLFKAQIKAAGKKVNNALCEHFACTRQELFEIVKIKRIKTFDELIRAHGRGHGCEICKPAVASILASLWNENVVDHTHDPGHQRPLPGQHPARRHLFGHPARARRRDHAGEADRPRPGRQEVRPLHEDHRRPAHRPVRRARSSAAGHLGGAGRRRLRERPRLRQGDAHGEELRRHDLVPLRRAGLRRLRHSRREPLQGHPRAAQAQGGGVAAASASAPRRRARTSASSPPRRAGTSTSAATAAPSRATPTCSPPTSTRTRASSTSTAS